MTRYALPLALALVAPALAEEVEVRVRTAIDPPSAQAGMKSEHAVRIDLDTGTVLSAPSVATGITDIGIADLPAARSAFSHSSIRTPDGTVTLTLNGTTASGIQVMPDIDYRFTLTFSPDGTWTLAGNHDGYPSYDVWMSKDEAPIYRFDHPQYGFEDIATIWALLRGDGDDVRVEGPAGRWREEATEPAPAPRSGGVTGGGHEGGSAGGGFSTPIGGFGGGSRSIGGGGGGCSSQVMIGFTIYCDLN